MSIDNDHKYEQRKKLLLHGFKSIVDKFTLSFGPH